MSAYRQPVERYWWARRRSYLRFMLREISCIFVAWFVLYLVLVLRAVGAGGNS
ncbi:fumarate reductase frdC [Mycobacterium tuberculosis]|nr:fumarate reductase frdC [Mycobacterium tuberculosis]CNG46201.1 fumarate reductase frdC [Mycobacterium tuberculosis]SGP70296.1 fumarate reductase frdC [Mycobacterium tuberculosis]